MSFEGYCIYTTKKSLLSFLVFTELHCELHNNHENQKWQLGANPGVQGPDAFEVKILTILIPI